MNSTSKQDDFEYALLHLELFIRYLKEELIHAGLNHKNVHYAIRFFWCFLLFPINPNIIRIIPVKVNPIPAYRNSN